MHSAYTKRGNNFLEEYMLYTIDHAFMAQFRAYLSEVRASRVVGDDTSVKRRNKQVIDLTLAVRRILRSALIADDTMLVQSAQPGCISLVDGYRVQRAEDGTVQMSKPGTLVAPLTSHELLKLGAKGTRIVSCGVVDRLWEQHIAGPIWEQLGVPRVAFNYKSFLVPESSDAEATSHVLNSLRKALVHRFLGNFWHERKTGGVLGDALWRHVLDREVASLTLKLFGSSATLLQYNRVAQNAAVLRQIGRETPNLMRLLGVKLETRDIAAFEDGVTSQAAHHLREHYLSKGFTPAGWAFLTHQGASMVHLLVSTGPQMVNRLAELQCGKLPYGHWIYHLVHRGYMLSSVDNFCKLLVLFAQDHAKRKTTAKELTDNLVFTLDYIQQANPKIGKQTTFKGFLRKQEEWHRKLAHENRQRQLDELTELYTWQPLVQSVEIGELKATSLNSSMELIEEGTVMGHCVGGYFRTCFQNRCRIFSLTLAGQRVATLEVTYRTERWSQGQLYGPGNSKITDKRVIQLAKRVVSACNKAPAVDAGLNTVYKLQPAEAAKPKALQLRQQHEELLAA